MIKCLIFSLNNKLSKDKQIIKWNKLTWMIILYEQYFKNKYL